MNVFNPNLTVKEKQIPSISVTSFLQKAKNLTKMQPQHRNLGYHQKSKSYHIDPFSKNYLEDKNLGNFGSSEENLKNEKSSSSNLNNNDYLEKIEENPDNASMIISPQIQGNNPLDHEEFEKFNMSDEKFIRFLDRYLNYLDKNEELKYEKEESIYNSNNETDGSNLIKKILVKYKKKCAEFQAVQNNFWRQLQDFKDVEKHLQKVKNKISIFVLNTSRHLQ